MSVLLGFIDRTRNVGLVYTDADEFTAWTESGTATALTSPVLDYLWQLPCPDEDLRTWEVDYAGSRINYFTGYLSYLGIPDAGSQHAAAAEWSQAEFRTRRIGPNPYFSFGEDHSPETGETDDIAWTVSLPAFEHVKSLL